MGGPWRDLPPPRVPREPPVAVRLTEARLVAAAIVAALLVLALVCAGVL